jgi:NADPH2:quinone reductase
MRAIRVHATGGPENLTPTDVETPTPGPGEILAEVAAAGVNFVDTYQRSGLYVLPLPFTPGGEGAGRVAAVGEGVTGFAVGDRIAWADQPGTYAEQVCVKAERTVPVPDGIGLETAAATMLQGITAQYLTHSTYPIRAGETALVHAAAGGVGLLVTQLVKAAGGTVIGTVSTEAKAELAREAGADEVIRYDTLADSELAAEVRRRNGGEGVHVAYDGVGAATFEASLASLRLRGTLVSFGNASGPVPPFPLLRLSQMGSLFVTRPTMVHYIVTREDLLARVDDLFGRILDGSLTIRIGGTYPLAEAEQAHRDLEGRKTTAKLLLIP